MASQSVSGLKELVSDLLIGPLKIMRVLTLSIFLHFPNTFLIPDFKA